MLYSYETKIINGEEKLVKVVNAEELVDWVNDTKRLLIKMGTEIATLQSQIEYLKEKIYCCYGQSRH